LHEVFVSEVVHTREKVKKKSDNSWTGYLTETLPVFRAWSNPVSVATDTPHHGDPAVQLMISGWHRFQNSGGSPLFILGCFHCGRR
jgi:hypothetical protein